MKKSFVVLYVAISLMACSDIEDAAWNNPRDPQGWDYYPPVVALTDTSFYRTDTVVFVLQAQSGNSVIVERSWTLDGVLLQAGDTLRSNGWSWGEHTLVVRVVDGNGLSASDTAQISILNYAPLAEKIRDTVLASGEVYQRALRATDPDGSVVSYRWTSRVGSVENEQSTVVLLAQDSGAVDVIWSASDSEGAVAADSFRVQWGIQDTRDGRVYKTVRIGNQLWIAENLNYIPSDSSSRCYGGKDENCVIYGRLYNWNSAVVACPAGSHLPSSEEWQIMEKYVLTLGQVGPLLKSTQGWGSGGGSDSLGFQALPGGAYDGIEYYYQGTWGYWWTASEVNVYSGYVKSLSELSTDLHDGIDDKAVFNSVRCVVNQE